MDDCSRLELFWRKEALRYVERTVPSYAPYRIAWAKFLLKLEPKKVLEVGCNIGQNLTAIWTLNQGVELHGCDIASISSIPHVTFSTASAYTLPYPDNFSDLVFTHGLLMHLPPTGVKQAVSELKRVSSKYVVIREDIWLLGDGSYAGEPQAIFIHDYLNLFEDMMQVFTREGDFYPVSTARKRFTGVFKKWS